MFIVAYKSLQLTLADKMMMCICVANHCDANVSMNAEKQNKNYNAYLSRMEELLAQINSYKQEIESFISNDGDAAESFRIKFLGTKGIVKNMMQEMKNVPADKKKKPVYC